MTSLTKHQAEKIVELTSAVFQQGNMWVMQEMDLDSGVTRLTRGLSEKTAKKKLKTWRREKMEELLRSNGQAKAYALRTWHENPSWNGEGIWQWAHRYWYTSKEEAEAARERREAEACDRCEIFETTVAELPGHFVVA